MVQGLASARHHLLQFGDGRSTNSDGNRAHSAEFTFAERRPVCHESRSNTGEGAFGSFWRFFEVFAVESLIVAVAISSSAATALVVVVLIVRNSVRKRVEFATDTGSIGATAIGSRGGVAYENASFADRIAESVAASTPTTATTTTANPASTTMRGILCGSSGPMFF